MNYFNENRLVFLGEKPKGITEADLNKALKGSNIEKTFGKSPLKMPKKEGQEQRQRAANKLEEKAKALLAGLKRPHSDYEAALGEAKTAKLSTKEFQNAHSRLAYGLRNLGPEANQLVGNSREAVIAIGKAMRKLPNYEQMVKAYHILLKGGKGEIANRRRLERSVKTQLIKVADDKLLSYLLRIEMGPVKTEKPSA